MSQKYLDRDFRDARFAVHETGRAIAIRWTGGDDQPEPGWIYERPLNNQWTKEATDGEMADMGGWTPVPARPVVTESEIERAARAAWGYCARDTDRTFLEQLGVEVIKDPEPTNTELLAGIIRGIDDWQGITSPELLAKYLNSAGVTAPEEDNA